MLQIIRNQLIIIILLKIITIILSKHDFKNKIFNDNREKNENIDNLSNTFINLSIIDNNNQDYINKNLI